ncbi:lysophospholipid acyltransferase family protein [Legionella gresilensis]|uniref:lysophospholipid acyltransferase family protein n=1 Tax=Legionella gresilensis TaxID=91823 RepID=UPI001041B72C|nr:lysophospholipid acyltransferase family protein [Legionella gresilensis]
MNFVIKCLRYLFFAIFVRFIIFVLIGAKVRNREKLPKEGPAVIVANHNSHLDTLMLVSLFKLKLLDKIHPVAAADYFMKTGFSTWFSKNIIGIIPINRQRKTKKENPLIPCYQALDNNEILILFPEGTRGDPEKMSEFKKGISFIAERYPHVPITSVFMYGLGKALPKGKRLLVPFACDVLVGDSIRWQGDRTQFMNQLNKEYEILSAEVSKPDFNTF